MTKRVLRRLGIAVGATLGGLALLALVVPLLLSPDPSPGTSTVDTLMGPMSRIVTVPFEGTDGIDLHVVDRGDPSTGEPVFVLLHGSNFNASTWNDVIDGLSEIGRTVAYDQVPYGLSEKLVEGDWSGPNPYTPEAAVQRLNALLDERNLDRVVLIGSSYGGTLAVRAALTMPERIAGLVLVDAAVFVNESMPAWLLNSPQMARLGPLMARFIGTGTAFYEQCYSDPALFTGVRKQRTMVMTQLPNWDFALWAYLKAWGTESMNYEEQLSTISIPTLVMSGSEDAIVPPEDSRKLQNLLPDASLVMIDGAGHLPHEESPAEFLEAVKRWMTDQGILSLP